MPSAASLRVAELAPPAVQTGAGPGATHGAPLEEFSDALFAQLQRAGAEFIGFGPTDSPEFREMREATEPFSDRALPASRCPPIRVADQITRL